MSRLIYAIFTVVAFFARDGACNVPERASNSTETLFKNTPYYISVYMATNLENKTSVLVLSCGGSLITKLWVLSAARHSQLRNPNNRRYVISGATKDTYPEDLNGYALNQEFQIRPVSKCVFDNTFARPARFDVLPALDYDIMLLSVQKPFEITPTTKPIPLPSPQMLSGKDASKVFKNCITVGKGFTKYLNLQWGECDKKKRTEEFQYEPDVPLRQQKTRVISLDACRRSGAPWLEQCFGIDYNIVRDDVHMCTMYYPGRSGPCLGDTGAPLICNGLQFGVSSGLAGCGYSRKFATVWTRVDHYNEWIQKHIPGISFETEWPTKKAQRMRKLYKNRNASSLCTCAQE